MRLGVGWVWELQLFAPLGRFSATGKLATMIDSIDFCMAPLTRPAASWNVVTPLLSARTVPVTRPTASGGRDAV